MKFYRLLFLSLVLGGVFLGSAFARDIPEKETLQRGGVQELQARIRMYSGRLAISADLFMVKNDQLLEAEYVFHTPTKRPKLLYQVQENSGHLILEQDAKPTIGRFPELDQIDINEWSLHLAPQVDLDFQIVMHAGAVDLDFSHLNLKTLKLDLGTSEATIDLSGVKDSAVIVINASKASLNLTLSQQQPTVLTMQRGETLTSLIGFQKQDNLYYNAAYQKGQPYVYIDLKADSKLAQIFQK